MIRCYVLISDDIWSKLYFRSIPRIRLLFKADDPDTYAMRLKFAVQFRKEVENNIRFVLIILRTLPHYV